MVTAGMTKTHPLMMKMINRKEKKIWCITRFLLSLFFYNSSYSKSLHSPSFINHSFWPWFNP